VLHNFSEKTFLSIQCDKENEVSSLRDHIDHQCATTVTHPTFTSNHIKPSILSIEIVSL